MMSNLYLRENLIFGMIQKSSGMQCCYKVCLRGQFFLSGSHTDSKKAISKMSFRRIVNNGVSGDKVCNLLGRILHLEA